MTRNRLPSLMRNLRSAYRTVNAGSEDLPFRNKLCNTWNYITSGFQTDADIQNTLIEPKHLLLSHTYAGRYMVVKGALPKIFQRHAQIVEKLKNIEQHGMDHIRNKQAEADKATMVVDYLTTLYSVNAFNRLSDGFAQDDFEAMAAVLPFEQYREHVLYIAAFIQEHQDDTSLLEMACAFESVICLDAKKRSDGCENFNIWKIIDTIQKEADRVRAIDPAAQSDESLTMSLAA